MLTKYQEKGIKWLRRCYCYMYDVPVAWNSKQKRLSIQPQSRKWLSWGLGNFIVFLLWYSCVYTLSTQFYMKRKEFKLLHMCVLTTGLSCFTATLFSAHGLFALKNNLYISAVNQYIQLELNIFKGYCPKKLKPDQPISKIDILFLVVQLGNILPYLIYTVCIFWNVDGPYWMLEDFGPDPKYRHVSTILLFLFIRTNLLMPGFLETTRTLIYTSLSIICTVAYQKDIIRILAYKVKNQSDFFRFYMQLYIVCNVLGPGFERATFLIISIFYFLFIQTLWVCVAGFGELDITVYSFFALSAIFIILSVGFGLPIVASTGDIISNLAIIKVRYSKQVYSVFRTKSLRAIRFSYGNFCPMDKKFTRNLFDNLVQNLLTAVLLFDI